MRRKASLPHVNDFAGTFIDIPWIITLRCLFAPTFTQSKLQFAAGEWWLYRAFPFLDPRPRPQWKECWPMVVVQWLMAQFMTRPLRVAHIHTFGTAATQTRPHCHFMAAIRHRWKWRRINRNVFVGANFRGTSSKLRSNFPEPLIRRISNGDVCHFDEWIGKIKRRRHLSLGEFNNNISNSRFKVWRWRGARHLPRAAPEFNFSWSRNFLSVHF